MKTLLVTSEIYPFIKTGGLADVSSALPRALKAKGAKIATVTPGYAQIKALKGKKSKKKITVEAPAGRFEFSVHTIKEQGVEHYFLVQDALFDRKEIYGDYLDNGLRFGLFCLAVTKLAADLEVEWLHLNDWQSALLAYLVERLKLPFKTLLTIHNIAYQGVFNAELLGQLGLGDNDYRSDRLEFYGFVNFLKAGIVYADRVSTVSPTYLEEVMQEGRGFGLEGVMRTHQYKCDAVLNGLDVAEWSPLQDPALFNAYDVDSLKDRSKNRQKLCRGLGLDNPDYPLFVMISRLVKHKGVALLIEAYPFLRDLDINLVVVGEGESHFSAFFDKINGDGKKFCFYRGYKEELSRKLYASADFLLMPSLTEPCGLNQLIAFRYGCLPIVHDTGGLHDTVCDYHRAKHGVSRSDRGQGIVFDRPDGMELIKAVSRALALYTNKRAYKKIQKANMCLDLSWDKPAERYLKIYRGE